MGILGKIFGSDNRSHARALAESVARPPSPAELPRRPGFELDYAGLQVAFLDGSGQIEYYVDREGGDVLTVLPERLAPAQEERELVAADPQRYIRIPSPDPAWDEEDMLGFAATGPGADSGEASLPGLLAAAATAPSAAVAFRDVLRPHPQDERAWFTYKKQRIAERMQEWIDGQNFASH